MKSFKQYLLESILDDEDELATKQDLWSAIQKFLKDNYHLYGGGHYVFNMENDEYVVSAPRGTLVANNSIKELTNGMFKFGLVD